MRVSVVFQDEQLAMDLPDAILVGSWEGPMGLATEQVAELVRSALEHPLEFPPFRQMVVPGDRVAIALDASLGKLGPVLHVLDELLRRSGVDAGDVTVVATPGGRVSLGGELPPGVAYEVHDPGDSRRLAYLATTEEGRRIYLNRKLTDADVVVPVGRLGYDPVLGYRGPWRRGVPGAQRRGDRRGLPSSAGRRSSRAGHASPQTRRAVRGELASGHPVLHGAGARCLGPCRDHGRSGQTGARRGDPGCRPQLVLPEPDACRMRGCGNQFDRVEAGIGDLVEGLVTAPGW